VTLDLLYITPSGETLPSVRFRVLPFVDLALKRGLTAHWRRAPKTVHQRLVFLLTLPQSKVTVIQQKLCAPWELALIRRRTQKLVYDVDDALWALHPAEAGQPGSQRKAALIKARFAETCRRVDLVIAGNDYLAEHVREHQQSVFVLPTLLDTDKYTPPPPDACALGPLRVGWMGTSGNLWFLPEVLRQLAPHQDRLSLHVVSDEPYEGELRHMVRFERWSAEREADQLRGFQAGLMPLTDDEYTRGKCGFKILQYMACGVAPVASAVGFNTQILTHGEDGLLVRQPSDWAAHLLRLANDRELLERMAAQARRTVVERFSLSRMAPRLWKALGLAGTPGSG
jgi:glycosyltransferase involved in cell wall biosynthesis